MVRALHGMVIRKSTCGGRRHDHGGIERSEGANGADRPGGGSGLRSHGRDHRGAPGQRRRPGAAARRRPQGGRRPEPARRLRPGGAREAEARRRLPPLRPLPHRGREPGGRPPAPRGLRLGRRGGGREHGGEEAAARGEGGPAPARRRHPLQQHQRTLGERDRRGAPRGAAPALPRHPLLQPAALHAAGRGGSEPIHRSRRGRLHGRLHRAAARQGRGPRQGHAQLRGQPHRRVLHGQRHPPHRSTSA